MKSNTLNTHRIPAYAVLVALTVGASVNAATLAVDANLDAVIRDAGSNGTGELVLIGDTGGGGTDFLRSTFAFDLSDPLLTGATINSITLTLTLDGKDTNSLTQAVTIGLHELSSSFTNDATWATSDGTTAWSTAGGDFGASLVSLAANAGTVTGGDELVFADTGLTSAGAAAVGGQFYLLAKMADEGSIDRSIFRIQAIEKSGGTAPFLTIDYTAIPEPSAAVLGSLGLLCLLRRRR